MFYLDPMPTECDMCRTSIEENIKRLLEYKKKKESSEQNVFFIVYLPQFMVFRREHEDKLRYADSAVFFVPKHDLSPYDWDVVMYSADTGEAIARHKNRPTS